MQTNTDDKYSAFTQSQCSINSQTDYELLAVRKHESNYKLKALQPDTITGSNFVTKLFLL